MVSPKFVGWVLSVSLLACVTTGWAEPSGGIRGMVYDKDFDAPLSGAHVLMVETAEETTSGDEGNYVLAELEPGTYTLVFSKDGYTRQVKADVVVSPSQMTEVDVWLAGDFTEMEEFIVQVLEFIHQAEVALLNLRMESPALMDSISADLMSQAGASDAAGALKLVSGATVQEGKYAVIRGLPDRYVNSQMNGVRLPTADADKRAVQLDQFPAAVIDSIQVSKTFMPDQQGDASGGAVNLVLKGAPDEALFKFSTGTSYNTQVTGNDKFLSYKGGGVGCWGMEAESRDIQSNRVGESWLGAVGVTPEDAPSDYKWSLATGGKHELDTGIKIGGFGSFYYERDSAFYDDGIDDSYWVDSPGEPMTPQHSRGSPRQQEFLTSLFDVTQGSQEVKWGGLGTVGLETEDHVLTFLYMHTHAAEDVATLAENTAGKKGLHWFWPDIYGPEYDSYDPDDPTHPGNEETPDASPYLRNETLEYTERSTQTFQLTGRHTLGDPDLAWEDRLTLLPPELDWGVSHSSATMDQPDKRLFGTEWRAATEWTPAWHLPFKPAASFTLGNLQRTWKDISEESDQFFVNAKAPFKQWTEDEGYFKVGVFHDKADREYNQESFSNFGDNSARYAGPWEDIWSDLFPSEEHPITAGRIDVDYEGEQEISAWYYMADVPLCSWLNVMGGVRYESTDMSIVNHPEEDVTWVPPRSYWAVEMNEGDGDVDFSQDDMLPALGFEFRPFEKVTLRGSYSETVARQTFKELSPIQQVEYLGGDIFIGNPELQMSSLKNYDLRLDYTPYEGSLLSVSYFYKDITDPIEYVQRNAGFTFTTPANYPEGTLSGVELEARQSFGHFWESLEGLQVGANATFIDSEVTLPAYEQSLLSQPTVQTPMSSRDMTNAPEHLYNLYFTYDWKRYDAQFGVFYTVRGDTLIAGAGQRSGAFIPSVYETEYGTLNLSVSKKFGEALRFSFQAKNLLDPDIETVYRSKYIASDVTKTSYRKGREFSISMSVVF